VFNGGGEVLRSCGHGAAPGLSRRVQLPPGLRIGPDNPWGCGASAHTSRCDGLPRAENSPMRIIGFVGDIHGDASSLSWALETLEDCQTIVCVGDIAGASLKSCVQLLRSRQVVALQGNHDFLASQDQRLGDEERCWLQSLQPSYSEDHWLAYHTHTVRDGAETFWVHLESRESVLNAMGTVSQSVVFCGHTHIPNVNILAGNRVDYLSTAALRARPDVRVSEGCRYLVNVGIPSLCVVKYTPSERLVSFLFAPSQIPHGPRFWAPDLGRAPR